MKRNLLIVALLILATGGGFFIGHQPPEWLGKWLSAEEEVQPQASFYPLDKMIISVPGDEYPHYLLLELALKSRSDNAAQEIKAADPLIRNTMMRMFSSKSFNVLNQPQNLETLQLEARESLIKVLTKDQFTLDIEEVLFTRMVIQ
ncbi:flagellar basal body-associated FliL family protein [Shewanella algae]|uniref:flagellar basal body-associated FliL family protein n=1 Tax=Shewanella algae TaxID=38313 RepID=UPI003005AF10